MLKILSLGFISLLFVSCTSTANNIQVGNINIKIPKEKVYKLVLV